MSGGGTALRSARWGGGAGPNAASMPSCVRELRGSGPLITHACRKDTVDPVASVGAERARGASDGASTRQSGCGGPPCGVSRMAGRPRARASQREIAVGVTPRASAMWTPDQPCWWSCQARRRRPSFQLIAELGGGLFGHGKGVVADSKN